MRTPEELTWFEQLEVGGSMELLASSLGDRPVLRPALAELGKIKRSVRYGRPVRILPPAVEPLNRFTGRKEESS